MVFGIGKIFGVDVTSKFKEVDLLPQHLTTEDELSLKGPNTRAFPRSLTPLKCPACRESVNLTPFEERIDSEGNFYDLAICLNCLIIINATHLGKIYGGDEFLTRQSESSDEFYAVDKEYLDSVPEMVDAVKSFDFLFSMYPQNPTGVLIDFGAGRGILSASGARYFEKVYAAELSLNVLSQVHEVMPLREKVFLTQDFTSVPENFDCISCMHTLEHLPDIPGIFSVLVNKLNPGGSLYFQVPMLRRDYLVDVHYSFFNKPSARRFCESLGLIVVGIWFDLELDFLTCIAKKPT